MLVFANFTEFAVVVEPILRDVQTNHQSGFAEVVTQEAITGTREFGIFRFEVSGLGTGSLEASGEDRADARDGVDGLGDTFHLLGDGGSKIAKADTSHPSQREGAVLCQSESVR